MDRFWKVAPFWNLQIEYSKANFFFRRPLLHDFLRIRPAKFLAFKGLILKKSCNKGRLKKKFPFEYSISRFQNGATL